MEDGKVRKASAPMSSLKKGRARGSWEAIHHTRTPICLVASNNRYDPSVYANGNNHTG